MPLPKINHDAVEQFDHMDAESTDGGVDEQAENGQQPKKPGPGKVRVTRKREAIGALPDRKLLAKAFKTLEEGLEANRVVYGKSKDHFEVHPDWGARVRCAELIAAYVEGRPVERRLEIKANAATFGDHMATMMTSPEGIRFLLAAGSITAEAAEAAMQALRNETKPA